MMLSRRKLLQVGSLGLTGLGLPHILQASRQSQPKARVKSVIFLHQWGGPSHLDTFDMKPDAPAEVRGKYQPIASSLPGVPVCEKLPNMARVLDRVCQIRTLRHTMKNHNSAGYYSLSGYAPPSDDQRLRDTQDLFPAYGSVVDRLAPAAKGIPTFVAFPHVISDGSVTPGQHASFLGKAHDPLLITQDPNQSGFRLPELSLPSGLSLDRLQARREMLKLIDQQARLLEFSSRARGIEAHHERAVAMLSSPAVKAAFDLSREPQAVRERYGRTTYGQSCLLARRLVEAGAKFINVYFSQSIGGDRGGWDTHGFNDKPMYPILDNYLLPVLDQTLPTLIEDLEVRGLLDSTLVVWVGEFGRTPRINKLAGRDHWPQCYPALLCGAGVKRGYVYGTSDKLGAYPSSDPQRPEDLSATLFDLMGIAPETEVRDALDRPLPISPGSVIKGILA
ncbi:MAG: DUF1501 domain-containing protein [Gemmataceae bacterium]